jgi:hypothetical protein
MSILDQYDIKQTFKYSETWFMLDTVCGKEIDVFERNDGLFAVEIFERSFPESKLFSRTIGDKGSEAHEVWESVRERNPSR